ncbi:MAG TPA: glutamate formimidoyltransferase [Candidatus Acidoferrales bacterium]|nr:glutamate formimidoyltransferase [Candidatus Acidoferrales bacterium]
MQRIIECVPNFSEGRDPAKVDALVAAMSAIGGVIVLDREMDPDHNRSVITLAGEPEAVAEAALRGIGKAAELIDLTRHRGAHPRLGATDVVPFVPVAGVTLEECVALARRVGRAVWDRYRIPVYFYEAAAERPDRVNLEDVRRGQFEGVREEVLVNPRRAPDVGEPRLHPTAGATIVGARKFLIAYNINLDTADVSVAKNIAKAIRYSSGGLRYVKSMGIELKARGLAQVSINLTDFEQTPIHRVFEMVRSEAARYGAGIVGTEIVGLIPRRAIELTAGFYLQFENFSADQVLENRLEKVLASAASPAAAPGAVPGPLEAMARPLLAALAEPTAAPGGGSAAALAGAVAASLGQMVAALSQKKKSQAVHGEALAALLADLELAGRRLAQAIDRDAAAYNGVVAATRLPKATPEEQQRRSAAIEEATRQAAEVPLEAAESAADVQDKLQQLERVASPAMRSDLATARWLAQAAMRGAMENVAINLESLGDAAYVEAMKKKLATLETRLAEAPAAVAR